MKYVVAEDLSGGGVFCLGIYDNYHTALGHIITEILDFKKSYQGDGDFFEYTDPYRMEGDGGDCIAVKFKAACWTHKEEPETEYYYILFHEDGGEHDG